MTEGNKALGSETYLMFKLQKMSGDTGGEIWNLNQ